MDDHALAGLTLAWCIGELNPLTGLAIEGLDVLNTLLGQFELEKLPDGQDWLEHLDTLDAVRTSTLGAMKKLKDWYPERMIGYVASGIALDEVEAFQEKCMVALGKKFALTEHEFRPGYQRIAVVNETQLRENARTAGLSEEQLETTITLAREAGLGVGDVEAISGFRDAMDSRPNLARAMTWWDAIPQMCTITGVGKALARSNARRFDKLGMLPPLD